MNGRIVAVEQRSPEWFAARLGRLTGSCAGDMLATLRNGNEPAARRDLRVRLAIERITGRSAEDRRYVSRDMQRGIDREADARAAYEAATGLLVEPIGFVAHADLLAGCSPDGVADNEGLIEIKCPKSATHAATLRARAVPPEYVGQVVHNLWITGAPWLDFVSFDDRWPAPLQLVIVRYPARLAELASYELNARRFLDEVEREAAAIVALGGVA
jgi:hypothetical protein